MPIRYLPKAIVSAVIGVALFMSVMPNSIKGMPDWVFYSIFAGSLLIGWAVTTGIFKAVFWFMNR
jgi:hypothetical protein